MTIPATASASSPTTGPAPARRRMPRRRSTTHAAPETERSHNGLPMTPLGWYGQVLELLDRQPVLDEHARCEALVDLGIAQRMAGDPRHRDTLLGAADRAQRLASPALLVRAALATNQAGRNSYLRVVDEERRDTLEAALRATDGTETPERALLLATLVELATADPERARALSDDALVMARRVDDDFTLWQVLYKRAFAIWAPATLDERTANAYELREVAERLGDRTFRLGTARNLLVAAACRGDLAEVDQNIDVMIRLAAETGVAEARWVGRLGDWRGDDCSPGTSTKPNGLRGEALHVASQAEELDAYPLYGPQLYAIRRAQGRLDEMIEPFERAASANPGVALYRAVLLDALCSVDRLEDARAVFEPLAANRFTDFPVDNSWLTALTCCTEAAAFLEHRAGAAAPGRAARTLARPTRLHRHHLQWQRRPTSRPRPLHRRPLRRGRRRLRASHSSARTPRRADRARTHTSRLGEHAHEPGRARRSRESAHAPRTRPSRPRTGWA